MFTLNRGRHSFRRKFCAFLRLQICRNNRRSRIVLYHKTPFAPENQRIANISPVGAESVCNRLAGRVRNAGIAVKIQKRLELNSTGKAQIIFDNSLRQNKNITVGCGINFKIHCNLSVYLLSVML